jgi:hypothetical protein
VSRKGLHELCGCILFQRPPGAGKTNNRRPGSGSLRAQRARSFCYAGFSSAQRGQEQPWRKIKETDAIFTQVHRVKKQAGADPGTIPVSLDTKAVVAIADLSCGGKGRQGKQALDHDFAPEYKVAPFGLFRPDTNETWLYFTTGPGTADFMVDRLQALREFSADQNITIRPAGYPPCHGKYNPIEQVFGGIGEVLA